MIASNHLRHRLNRDGYVVVPRFLPPERLHYLAHVAETVRGRPVADSLGRDRYTGHVTEMAELPQLAEALSWPDHFNLLREIGFHDPRWFMAFLLQKPPGSAGLYWHQDWWGWRERSSYYPAPPLLFMMFYLVDTGPRNGCLRVLPGTHLRQHPLHRASALADYTSPSSFTAPELFSHAKGEVNVPVSAGDLVIRDARLLHATHANCSPEWRPMLSLSVAGNYRALGRSVRRTMEVKRPKIEKVWSTQQWEQVRDAMCLGPAGGEMLPIDRTPSFQPLSVSMTTTT